MALFVNFTKMEYIEPEVFGDEDSVEGILDSYDGCKTALALLIADGNGRGSGDFETNHPLVGSWAGDRIGLISKTDTAPQFALPGEENEPVYPWVKGSGKNISSEVNTALCEALGDEGYVPALFVENCVVPKTVQKNMFTGREIEELRADKAQLLDFLWPLTGARFSISPSKAIKSLESGIANTWERLHHEKVTVTIGKFEMPYARLAVKDLADIYQVEDFRAVSLKFEVSIKGPSESLIVTISLQPGFTPSEVFRTIFRKDLFLPKSKTNTIEGSL